MVVTTDSTRLLAYKAGALPPLPTAEPEKQALAQRLAAQYELLDAAERQQLKHLTPYAFPLLLARYVEWAKAYDTNPEGQTQLRALSTADRYPAVASGDLS